MKKVLKKKVTPRQKESVKPVVKQKRKVVTISEEVIINGGEYLLEAGDRLVILEKAEEADTAEDKAIEGEGEDVTDSLDYDFEDESGEELQFGNEGDVEGEEGEDEGEEGDESSEPELSDDLDSDMSLEDEDGEEGDIEDDDSLTGEDDGDEDDGEYADTEDDEAIDALSTKKESAKKPVKTPIKAPVKKPAIPTKK